MIIDCHAHFASPRFLPREFFSGWNATLESLLPEDASAGRYNEFFFAQMRNDECCEQLLTEMKRAAIDLAILLIIDFGRCFDMAISIEDIHLEHGKLMERDSRVICFSGVDPRRGKAGLELFEKAISEWGFKGLKLYPPCGYSPSDRMLYPFYDLCRHYRVPVLTHIGPTSSTLSFKHATPMEVDEAAKDFPGVNFILAHGAVVYAQEAGLMAKYRPNIFLDVSGYQSQLNAGVFSKTLQWLMAQRLSRKILFGTDWPFFRLAGDQKTWVETFAKFRAENLLADSDLENIFYKNILSLLPEPTGGRELLRANQAKSVGRTEPHTEAVL